MPSPPRIPGTPIRLPTRVPVPRTTPTVRVTRPGASAPPARPAPPPRSAPPPAAPPRPIPAPPTRALVDPEPPIPREPPPGDSQEVARWILDAIHAHERLRTKSFYDTGMLIERLLSLREAIGARDIKDLCSKVDLGLSHMTANKYLQVARTFDRETAVRHGVEKCYALIGYSKVVGRPGEAAAILAADEAIRGLRGLRASTASAAKIYAAIKAMKDAAREARVDPVARAEAEKTAVDTEKLLRSLGMKGANATVTRRGREEGLALFIPLEVARSLEAALPHALAKLGLRLARKKPDLFAPLREAGWSPRHASA